MYVCMSFSSFFPSSLPALSFLFKTRSHYVAQVALSLAAIILPHPFENRAYGYETPHPPRSASLWKEDGSLNMDFKLLTTSDLNYMYVCMRLFALLYS